MARVIGIGGIFFKFKDPDQMRVWYQNVLGMTINDYGVLFEFNGDTSNKKGYLQLGTFPEDSTYFGSVEQQAMINFRVDELETFMTDLQKKGVTILNEIERYPYGNFLHIADPEGNRIELWEPIDTEFESSDDPKMPMN